MSTYHLYDCQTERRLIIDPALRAETKELKLVKSCSADSWLEAKKELGFELTADQQWLLDRQWARTRARAA